MIAASHKLAADSSAKAWLDGLIHVLPLPAFHASLHKPRIAIAANIHKGDLHPQIILEGPDGKILDFYYMPEKAHLEIDEGTKVSAGNSTTVPD